MYLGMASASIPAEYVFSSPTLLQNGKRPSLKPYKLEQMLFVHDNFPLDRERFVETDWLMQNYQKDWLMCYA